MSMTYFGELRANWRAIVSAAIGQGAGLSINVYVFSIFAPYLMKEFGWSQAQFALVGMTTLVVTFCLPVIGRMTDRFGVRRVAAVGVIAMPASFLALSLFHGDIFSFVGLYALQLILGATTSSIVYSRVIAERFERARGTALGIMTCGPALVGGVGSPLLNHFIETHGWRAGYQELALYSISAGVLALAMIPKLPAKTAVAIRSHSPAKQDYALILRSPAFWIIFGGIFLCAPTLALHNQQKLMLLDNGASSEGAAMMMSCYAIGVAAGRFLCGLALDRLPAHIVAAVSLGVPAIGLFLIASSWDAAPVLAFSVALLGLSLGAEGDVTAFLVARYFKVQVFSSVFGLVTAAVGVGSAIGSALLSASLKGTGHFATFVLTSGICVAVGSSMFLLLGLPSIAKAALGSTAPVPETFAGEDPSLTPNSTPI